MKQNKTNNREACAVHTGPGISIEIQRWDYRLIRESDGRFYLWRTVTPADGGYSADVRVYFEADYFETHSVKQFYNCVANMNSKPRPELVDKKKEMEDLTQALRKIGWK